MKVLVTGGAGFIGSNMVEALLRQGHDVRVLDNFSTGMRANIGRFIREIDLVEGDLQSYERAHNAVRGVEVVLHQGALPSVPRSVQDPLTTNAVNITGTLNVLLASRDEGVRRVVYASSSSVYGESDALPKHEAMAPKPLAPYAVSKLAGENYCQAFSRVYPIETVCLRYFNVFGPRQDPASQYAAVIPSFIGKMMTGNRPIVFGDGSQTRDFTYVANVVEANIRAAEAESVSGQVFNIACGRAIKISELVRELNGILQTDTEPIFAPSRLGEIRHSLADTTKAQSMLGYTPRVSFANGLRSTVDWCREQATVGASSSATRDMPEATAIESVFGDEGLAA